VYVRGSREEVQTSWAFYFQEDEPIAGFRDRMKETFDGNAPLNIDRFKLRTPRASGIIYDGLEPSLNVSLDNLSAIYIQSSFDSSYTPVIVLYLS